MRRDDAFNRLRRVRDDFDAVSFALENVAERLERGGMITTSFTVEQLRRCATNLESTYLVRLFAEFEAILRDYWRHARRRRTRPQMERLIDSIAAYCDMNDMVRKGTHEVRKHRNDLVHHEGTAKSMRLSEVLARLGQFLSWLPLRW